MIGSDRNTVSAKLYQTVLDRNAELNGQVDNLEHNIKHYKFTANFYRILCAVSWGITVACLALTKA